MGMTAGAANKYGKKHNVPVVYTIHTNYRLCYQHALKSKLLAEILLKHVVKRTRKADCICVVSKFMGEVANDYGIKNETIIIKNGAIPNALKPAVSNKTKEFQLLYVGLVVDFKNIGFSLKALSIVKNTRSDFKFKIVGRGPDIKIFKKQAEKLGITENVEFVGVIRDRALLNQYYSNADLFLFPSRIDTDGLVILEASNMDTPSLVLENIGASERIIDGESGFVCKDDVNAYAQKILELMDMRDKLPEIGAKAKFSFDPWQVIASKYADLYKELIEKKKNK